MNLHFRLLVTGFNCRGGDVSLSTVAVNASRLLLLVLKLLLPKSARPKENGKAAMLELSIVFIMVTRR